LEEGTQSNDDDESASAASSVSIKDAEMSLFESVFEKVCPGKERNETNLL